MCAGVAGPEAFAEGKVRSDQVESVVAGQRGAHPESVDALARGVRPLMWFDSATPLRSGWAWGQNYLEGGVVAAEATVGRGTVRMIGFEPLFRAQPAGTFKLVFNGLIGVNKPTM